MAETLTTNTQEFENKSNLAHLENNKDETTEPNKAVDYEYADVEVMDDGTYEYLSKQVAEQYMAIIDSLTGKEVANTDTLDAIEGQAGNYIKKIKRSIDSHRERQRLSIELNNMTPEDFLRPIVTKLLPQDVEQFIANARYHLEELSPGICALYLDYKSFNRIMPGTYAVAVKRHQNISFIMIQDYGDDASSEAMERNKAENIPHETHHIAWYFLELDGVVEIAESDPDWQEAYSTYQDELVARMVSNGSLFGYAHYHHNSMIDIAPEKKEVINDLTGRLNDFLHEELALVIRETDSSAQELLFATIAAKNFRELEQNLRRMKEIIEKRPKVERMPVESANPQGWGSIGV
jgi:hypothetical protein